MRTRLSLVLLTCAVVALSAGPASAATKKPIYVSLGDSLAWSYSKTPTGQVTKSAKGYTELLAAKARKTKKYGSKTVLKRFGCPGESTGSYLGKTPRILGTAIACGFAKNQHADSLAYIKKNRKRLGFITLSVGANNFVPCSAGGGVDIACVQKANGELDTDLPKIYRELRKAAGSKVPIVVFTQYDPYLALYLQGGQYAELALLTVDLVRQISQKITAAGAKQKFKVADVFTAFKVDQTKTTTTVNGQTIPVAVAQNCAYTFMCQPAPVGPDIHPTDAGYSAIATAAGKVLKIN
jgi:lysophospholipase L1-like esterase